MNKLLQVGFAGILSFGISIAASADDDEIEEAIEYRQAGMEMIAWNFGRMAAMVKGKMPYNATAFAERAENVAALSKMALEGFIPISPKGDTDAKASIWTNWDDFNARMVEFENQAAQLANLAKTATTLKEVVPQFKNTALCKGCHRKYKK
ncbi:MAG TPA: cytochrome C [Gammaproteobacteria bacterium]|nr:cytochrome C [Gammaproteobacteria bacterium]